MSVTNSKNHIGIFRSKSFVPVEIKGHCRNSYFNKGFVCNYDFNNCAALLSENSTNSLKVETRTHRYLQIPFLEI